MYKVWVTGKKSFELDGSSCSERSIPFNISATRGSSVCIIFYTECCGHWWLEETYFHKGEVFRHSRELTDADISKYVKENSYWLGMWRD